ncbi:MAG: glucose-1-phosphate cytidylyltransferase [Bacillota bacterium]
MKVVILAGGLGTRLAEVTTVKPKPMVEIGGLPILWHIMKIYSHHGFRDFVIALGYKGEQIKNYFLNYHFLNSDFSIDLGSGKVDVHDRVREDWRITLVGTGASTQTGGRVKHLASHIGGETFMLTYGDGVADIDLAALLKFHRSHGKLATVTAVRPIGRFGAMVTSDGVVKAFEEKPVNGEGWINGGFFVFEPGVLDYIAGAATILEREPLENLVRDGQLMAYNHASYWQCMDTLRDVRHLNEQWATGHAPWKVWD